MNKISCLRKLAFSAVGTVCLATAGFAQSFSSVVVFGDSLSDVGNLGYLIRQGTPPYPKSTTNPDPLWSEIVSEHFGDNALPALAGGTIYASIGACARAQTEKCTERELWEIFGYPPSVPEQVNAYLRVGNPNPNALHIIFAGSNDVIAIAEEEFPTPSIENGGTPLSDEVRTRLLQAKLSDQAVWDRFSISAQEAVTEIIEQIKGNYILD